MLVEDAAPQCRASHAYNVPAHPEDEKYGERSNEPRNGSAERAAQLENVNTGAKSSEKGRTRNRPPQAIATQDHERKRDETHEGEHAQIEPRTIDWVADQAHRGNAGGQPDQETPALAHQCSLFLLERPKLIRIGDGVADILERLQQVLGMCHLRVVLD